MAKRKRSQVEIEYSKQRKRIQSFIRKHEKEGFYFEENILPAIPKKITKASVSRLQKITPKKLYSKAVYAGEASYGEVVSSYKGRQLRKQEAKAKRERRKQLKKAHINTPSVKKIGAKKSRKVDSRKNNISTDTSFYARTVLSGWYGLLESYSNGAAYPLLRRWMNKLIRDNGEEVIARMLEDAANNGYILVWPVAYHITEAIEYMDNVIKYIQDYGHLYMDLYVDDMEENIQYWKDLGEASESDEDWERPF